MFIETIALKEYLGHWANTNNITVVINLQEIIIATKSELHYENSIIWLRCKVPLNNNKDTEVRSLGYEIKYPYEQLSKLLLTNCTETSKVLYEK